VELVTGDAARARAEARAAGGEALAARLRVAELAGWPADRPPAPAGGLETLPASRRAPPLADLLALAERTSPELREAAAALDAARAAAMAAGREAAPKPSVGVRVSSERGEGSLHGVLSVPLPVFGRNDAERGRAAAGIEAARADADAVRASLPARLARAAAEVDAAWARAEAFSGDALPSAERALALGRRAVELGAMDLMDLGTLQMRALTLQREGMDALAGYHRAAAALGAIVGAEPWPEEAAPAAGPTAEPTGARP
jgi:cobalt-zinc-cadmium efflux system outer membrane protein